VAQNSNRHRETAEKADGLLKTFGASLLALLTGLSIIFSTTDRSQAFTTETLRRSEVNRTPRTIPDFSLIDTGGRSSTLRKVLGKDERVWIIDFVYTRCQTVCSSLGSIYQQLQADILRQGLQNRVGLLSISFDPANDNALALTAYATRMQMDPAVWRIMTLSSPKDRRRLLDSFGIMVIPAALGEFEHNAALHIVDPIGRLVKIQDYAEPQLALQAALALNR
jgi:protein SCO1